MSKLILSKSDLVDALDIQASMTRSLMSHCENPLDPLDWDLTDEIEAECFADAQKLDHALELLCASPTFCAAVDQYPTLSAIDVGLDSIDVFGLYYPSYKSIVARYGLETDILTAVLAHEFRHAMQDIEGLLVPEKDTHKALNKRLYEADARAFQMTVAWELADLGHEGVWTGCKFDYWRSGLCDIFERCVKDQAADFNNGEAQHSLVIAFLRSKAAMQSYGTYKDDAKAEQQKLVDLQAAYNIASNYVEKIPSMPYMLMQAGEASRVKREAYMTTSNQDALVQALSSIPITEEPG